MDEIRLIREEDFDMLQKWRDKVYKDGINVRTIYPRSSSYICKSKANNLYALAIFKLKDAPRAFVEHFIRNPDQPSDKHLVQRFQQYIEGALKAEGYKGLIALTKDEKVKKIHESLGYNSDSTYPQYYLSYKELN